MLPDAEARRNTRRTSFRNSVNPGVTEEVDRGLADIFRASTISWRLVARLDRKSTRLNSSHLGISYAVFCLKKKKKRIYHLHTELTKQLTLRQDQTDTST